MENQISWSDFEKIEICAGTIIKAEIFANAKKPAYQLEIDFGDRGIRKSSAQITVLYEPPELLGKQIVAVLNFPPKQIANFFSECLVLGLYGEEGVTLLTPDKTVLNGAKVG